MIGPRDEGLPAGAPPPAREGADAAPPWTRRPSVAFVTLWASGQDPGRDGLFRVAALRRAEDGSLERLERWCRPFPEEEGGGERSARATRRMAREFGVTGAALEGAGTPCEALAALDDFAGGRTWIAADAALARAWRATLAGEAGGAPRGGPPVVSLAGVAAALLPGRLASYGEGLAAHLTGRAPEAGPRALEPEHLREALGALLERVLSQQEASLAVLAHGYALAWRRLREEDPPAADELAFLLSLAEHPARACTTDGSLVALGALGSLDGRLGDAARAYPDLAAALDAAVPRCGREARAERRLETLPACADDEHLLAADDRRRVDEVFQVHLPRLLQERGGEGRAVAARPAQHALAAEIAERFGRRELLLQHAPTGTGKTLAYLVPALLWAWRHAVRVGVATYTRALQEQAMERDVPLALELLRRAGLEGVPRVALLKGRENYLCWRALRLEEPSPLDAAEDVLAWTALALFGLSDGSADLDRFPLRPPLESHPDGRASLARLVRRARAEGGCCAHQADRDVCGADAARRRAERAHVVITNHAFALARREFFRHLVFDECEHLHDVAHNAFSHTVPLRLVRELLERLWREDSARSARSPRSPLGRLAALVPEGSETADALAECLHARRAAAQVLGRLEEALVDFRRWREEELRARRPADLHSLFREYVTREAPAALLESHAALAAVLSALAGLLAQLSELLDATPVRGAARLRRSLDVLRAELEERLAAVEAWIPRREGAPDFRAETFYDLELDARGDDVLAARVLLPHEYLGMRFYPDLESAVFLSATTWLRGGFEAQAGFLGLARAASPRADEDRFPSRLVTFRTAETFDYGRVVVGVPRDAPNVRQGKANFLDYAARFLGFLAERTRGRLLALFTNADDVQAVGRRLAPFLAARRVPLWYQRMEGTSKEELSELFRATPDSVLFGLDTFWYGADFPGHTLEYLVLVRLPYGVPDDYHHAQCAAIGPSAQRDTIYLPRALAKFRQGFGRLMRRETDRGCVFVLDQRVLEPRHRAFLRELPVAGALADPSEDRTGLARLVVGDTDRVLHEAFAHMDMLADVRRRGLDQSFRGWRPGDPDREEPPTDAGAADRVRETPASPPRRPAERPAEIEPDELPF